MTDPLRVTLLAPTLHPSTGWGRFADSVCDALSRRPDVAITVRLGRDAPRVDSRYADRVRYDLPAFTTTFHGRAVARMPAFATARPPRRGETDLVHALVEFPYGWVARRFARAAQAPYVLSGHGTYLAASFERLPDRWLLRSACRDAAAVTAGSAFTRERFLELSGLDRTCIVMNYGVDAERFAPKAALSAPARRVVLTIGAHKPRKGFDILIDAFAKIASTVPDVDLVVIGPGDSTATRRAAAAAGISERVRILGEVSDTALLEAIHGCTLFALTPRGVGHAFEGFGLVFLEASAAGKPVIGSISGGVPDAILHEQTGLLVPEGDVSSTADAVLRILRDEKLAEQMGDAGREHAMRNTWRAYVDRLVSIYRAAVEVGPA